MKSKIVTFATQHIIEFKEFLTRPKLACSVANQSGYEPLNLENGSFVNSDNFDATDLRF